MISEFFYGSSWHWPLNYIPRVMLSYNYLRTIKHPWNINIPFMLDSGAYSVILKYGKYPFTAEEYADGIKLWKPDIAWTMDYPCEPKATEKGKYTSLTAQDMTIENQIKLLDQGVNTDVFMPKPCSLTHVGILEWINGRYNGQTYKDKIPRLKEYVSRIEDLLHPVELLYTYEEVEK